MRRANSWEIEYPGNWKVAVEGAIEDYHLPIGHPQIVRAAVRLNPELHFAHHCFYANSTHREYGGRSDEANPAAGAQFGLPVIPFAGADDARRTFFMNVFPTGMFQMHHHNAVQGLFLPAGADRTRLLFNHYYLGDVADDPRYQQQRDVITAEWQKVFEQDIPFVHYVHQNYLMRDAVGIDTRFAAVLGIKYPRVSGKPWWTSFVSNLAELSLRKSLCRLFQLTLMHVNRWPNTKSSLSAIAWCGPVMV